MKARDKIVNWRWSSRPSVLYMEQMRSSWSFWPTTLWSSISWNTIREAGYLISAGIFEYLNQLLLWYRFIICEKATNNSCKHSYRNQLAELHICRLRLAGQIFILKNRTSPNSGFDHQFFPVLQQSFFSPFLQEQLQFWVHVQPFPQASELHLQSVMFITCWVKSQKIFFSQSHLVCSSCRPLWMFNFSCFLTHCSTLKRLMIIISLRNLSFIQNYIITITDSFYIVSQMTLFSIITSVLVAVRKKSSLHFVLSSFSCRVKSISCR